MTTRGGQGGDCRSRLLPVCPWSWLSCLETSLKYSWDSLGLSPALPPTGLLPVPTVQQLQP